MEKLKTLQSIKNELDRWKVVKVISEIQHSSSYEKDERYMYELNDLQHWERMFNPINITYFVSE